MLEIRNLKKTYKIQKLEVNALKGINIAFRKNEFVSILGPSGCGKTTLLNMIGGLDKYTEGDILIDNISTKQFKNKDWDNYRNKRVGFVFQSYNLIPHQTILENVVLTLTIAGLKKEERIKRAKEALDKVGLEGLYNKRPNQLSGGQCQRVAIARAIVNEPEILLADEPTGALDTKTSVQIMDILKKISDDRLVIMVTHNPELANKYSTRIINLLDGLIIEDTNPYINEDNKIKPKETKNKSKMGFFTAARLSFKSLMTKKARTSLTCIAGSIGIIGVSLVLSLSRGVKDYIRSQEDTVLYYNPVNVSESGFDLNNLTNYMSPKAKRDLVTGKITIESIIEDIREEIKRGEKVYQTNILTKDYIKFAKNISKNDVEQVYMNYGYDIMPNIFTEYKITDNLKTETSLLNIQKDYIKTFFYDFPDYKFAINTSQFSVKDLIRKGPNNKILEEKTELIAGRLSENPYELVLNIGDNGYARDSYLALLGIRKKQDLTNIMIEENESYTLDFEEILNKTYTYYLNNDIYENKTSEAKDKFLLTQTKPNKPGIELKIVGIVKEKEKIQTPVFNPDAIYRSGTMTAGLYFNEAFEELILKQQQESEISKYGIEKEIFPVTNYTFKNIETSFTYYNFNIKTKEFSQESLTEAITRTTRQLGAKELPKSISFIAKNYATKDNIKKYLDKWNTEEEIIIDGKIIEHSNEIKYQDSAEFILKMISSITDAVTVSLIIFTSLSLVVSSVMIGVITYISVLEREKEIGTIRAIGGRKSDISKLFNSETMMLGIFSGAIGVGVTFILSILINAIVQINLGIKGITNLTFITCIIMILISTGLTTISGLIPARSAAKKDPAVALRSI